MAWRTGDGQISVNALYNVRWYFQEKPAEGFFKAGREDADRGFIWTYDLDTNRILNPRPVYIGQNRNEETGWKGDWAGSAAMSCLYEDKTPEGERTKHRVLHDKVNLAKWRTFRITEDKDKELSHLWGMRVKNFDSLLLANGGFRAVSVIEPFGARMGEVLSDLKTAVKREYIILQAAASRKIDRTLLI